MLKILKKNGKIHTVQSVWNIHTTPFFLYVRHMRKVATLSCVTQVTTTQIVLTNSRSHLLKPPDVSQTPDDVPNSASPSAVSDLESSHGPEELLLVGNVSIESPAKPELVCPLCRGLITGWTVMGSACLHESKSRSCACETCDFSGRTLTIDDGGLTDFFLVRFTRPRSTPTAQSQLAVRRRRPSRRRTIDVTVDSRENDIESSHTGRILPRRYVRRRLHNQENVAHDSRNGEIEFSGSGQSSHTNLPD